MMRILASLVVVVGLAACHHDNKADDDGGVDDGAAIDGTDNGDGAGDDGGGGGDGGDGQCHVISCNNHVLQCGDCVDNDQDGKIDPDDPECLGPCDNTEGPGLDPDVGGGGANTCQLDCFFDYGNGQGNDNCVWDHRCDPLDPEAGTSCAYDPQRVGTSICPPTQVANCATVCAPITPNGCDCFGCCTFPNAGPGGVGSRDVFIGALDSNNNSTCTFADIADPVKCPSCTPVQNCYNPCDMCEVCIGGPPPPPSCNPTQQCPAGIQPCGLPGEADCPANAYCISGCCEVAIP